MKFLKKRAVVAHICFIASFMSSVEAWKRKQFRPVRADVLPLAPETNMNTIEIIGNRGYPSEVHTVKSEDGYISELHRIPRGQKESADPSIKKRVVYIQHGLLGSSCDWVINPTNNSLPFILADQGYDVWLGNARGNTYSRKHVTLSPLQEQFWNFSWDEMGKYDIPAIIKYIQMTTGQSKLTYLGHSMGTTIFWVAMITHPELNEQIDLMIAMAPVSSLANLRSPVKYLASIESQIRFTYRLMGGRDFLDATDSVNRLQRNFCNLNTQNLFMCRNIMLVIGGANSLNFDPAIMPVLFAHNPAGTSIQTIAQFAQNYNSGETFIPFDHGIWGNIVRYGSIRPPPYDLSKVTVPVHLYWGQNDNLATPEDVDWLHRQLPNVKSKNRVSFSMFNHFDFTWAYDAKSLLYDSIVQDLKS